MEKATFNFRLIEELLDPNRWTKNFLYIEYLESSKKHIQRLLEKAKENLGKKCIVFGCQNHFNEETFIGDLCSPCHYTLTTNQFNRGSNQLRTNIEGWAKEVMSKKSVSPKTLCSICNDEACDCKEEEPNEDEECCINNYDKEFYGIESRKSNKEKELKEMWERNSIPYDDRYGCQVEYRKCGCTACNPKS